jgi:uncharacterized alkaline shock family protein YloU
MEGRASISADILARYAADAAREAAGVSGLVKRHGAKIVETDGAVNVELHLDVAWGASIPAVGREVQKRVTEYLERMASVTPAAVEVVVDGVGPPA